MTSPPTIVVPAAPAATAKLRLAGVLDDDARADLARTLLAGTIRASRAVGEVVVVSRDDHLLALAATLGADPVVERGTDLNAAVEQGLAVATARGATALVLPADLPLITTAAVRDLVARAEAVPPGEPLVVLTPCQREEGTNALLLRPAGLLTPRFGRDSFAAHLAAARVVGAHVEVHRSGHLVDLDTPADHRRLAAAATVPSPSG